MKKRLLAMIMALVMSLTFLVACNKGGKKGDPNATDEPIADAANTTEFVAKLGDVELYASDFKYFLYDALQEVDLSEIDISENASQKEQYEIMLAFLQEEDEDGISLLDTAVERAFELAAMLKATYLAGLAAGFGLDEEGILDQHGYVDEFIENYLSMYKEELGISSRDEMMELMYSMNVNDYKRLVVEQYCANEYAKDVIGKYSFTDEDIEAFYETNMDDYRIVEIRHILILTIDEDGEELDEEAKAKKLERAERVRDKILEGDDDIDALVKGYSEDNDLSTVGVYTVTKNSGYVKEFEDWALSQKEVTDIVEIIETSYGYHVMMCENIYGFEDEEIKEKVVEGIKSDTFDKEILAMLDLEEYAINERNDEVIKRSRDEYITMLFELNE